MNSHSFFFSGTPLRLCLGRHLGVLAGVVAALFMAAITSSQAQPAPQFNGVKRNTNGEIVLTLSAPAGKFYRVDVAQTLPDWEPLLMLKGNGITNLTDGGASYLNRRYYRAQESSDPAPITGDYLPTSQGPALLHPINHASVLLTWNGLAIYIDPVGASSVNVTFPKADLILVTHTHGDHFSASTLEAVRKSNALIFAPQAVYNGMSSTLKGLTKVLTNGASLQVQALGLSVDAVPAYNANHARGTGNGYVLTLGGRRIYFSGDTEDVAEMRALTQIDVAFLCMNLPFTMGVDKAASAVRQFRPKVVYPYHYRNQDNTFADLNDFKKRVSQDLGIEVRLRAWY